MNVPKIIYPNLRNVVEKSLLKQCTFLSTYLKLNLLSATFCNAAIPPSVWKLGRLNHIAIATRDLDKSTAFYRDILGAHVSEVSALPEHGVYTVFVNLDNTKLELLTPLGEKSPIEAFLVKNPNGGMHHICIEVKDIESAVEWVKEKGIRCLSKSTRIGAHGKPVMFMHPKDCGGVLVELEQE